MRRRSSRAEMLQGLGTRVSLLALESPCSRNKLHLDRHFDLQHIHAVTLLAELLHRSRHNIRFALCILQTFLVFTMHGIANRLQEERNIMRTALIAYALHPS